MQNALWLLAALPIWYFACLIFPFSAGFFTIIPAMGALSLIAGSVMALRARRRGLWLFGLLFLMSEALVAVAGFSRGHVVERISAPVLLTFLAIVLIGSVWLVWRMKGARVPAALLAIFCITYALFGASVAAMAFSDSWL